MPDWKTRPAGTLWKDGYIYIRLNGQRFLAQRLAWLLHYKTDPGDLQVDHVDGDKSNNCVQNLRLLTNQQNQFNRGATKASKSGIKGVCWDKKSNKWRAFGRLFGKQKLLGFFVDIEDAKAARLQWEKEVLEVLQK